MIKKLFFEFCHFEIKDHIRSANMAEKSRLLRDVIKHFFYSAIFSVSEIVFS